MRERAGLALLAGLLLTLLAWVGGVEDTWASDTALASSPIEIEIDFPGTPDQAVGSEGSRAFVSGQVLAYGGRVDRVDLILLLDVSGSTAEPAGIDVDGDGQISGRGFRSLFGRGNGADTIVAAELAAARSLLRQLDSRTTRVGVVIFSGQEGGGDDALTEVPLTRDYRRVERGLDEIGLVPPTGGTNLYAGLRQAARELLGRGGASSAPRRAQRYIVLLTDGTPTLPGERGSRQPIDRALSVARRLAERRIRVESFAVGPNAVDEPEAPLEVSRITRGKFTPVRDLADLENRVQQVQFIELDTLEVKSRTLDAPAECQVLTPEGQFFALVPARPGENQLVIGARTIRGDTNQMERSLVIDPKLDLDASLDSDQRMQLARLRELCRRPDSPEGPGPRRGIEIETEPPREPSP